MATANGSIIQGNFLHGLPRPALHGPAARGVAPPGPRPPIQRMANGAAVQVPVSPGFFGTGMGQRLPETIQRKMESVFGTRFDDVRVHVGPQATSLGALAFTHGSNIYFAQGQYNPQTAQGQRLLGHELTHVVQQRSGRARNPFGAGVAVLQDPALEAEAERMGLRAAAPEMGRLPAAPPFAVQRKPAMGAAPRVLQPRILPVPQPVRRGVLQRVHEEGLQALSMLFTGYESSQNNVTRAGEIQAMYIDSNIVVASNNSTELDSVKQLLRTSGTTIEALGGRMHTAASAEDGKKRFAANYDFLFGTIDNKMKGKTRADTAIGFVATHLTGKSGNLLNGVTSTGSASSASACADLLDTAQNRIIFLRSDGTHHAEQQLLEVLAWRLKKGTAPTNLGIRGVRKPCSACHRVLTAFATAYAEVYGGTLSYLSRGEGTEAAALNLKGIFRDESSNFGRFINRYDEVLNPPREEATSSSSTSSSSTEQKTERVERTTVPTRTSTPPRNVVRQVRETRAPAPVRRPAPRRNQGSSWGWGEWLAAAAVVGSAVYGVASMLMKEDPSRPQPSLPVPPGGRSRVLPP